MQVRVPEEGQKLGTCGCGRSPTGKCCGWHGLSEDAYRQALAEYDAKLMTNHRPAPRIDPKAPK